MRRNKQSIGINKIARQFGNGVSVLQRIISNDSLTDAAHRDTTASCEMHGAATRRVPEKRGTSQLSIKKIIRNGPKRRIILPLTRGVLAFAGAPPQN
jgi:hypothetical protein